MRAGVVGVGRPMDSGELLLEFIVFDNCLFICFVCGRRVRVVYFFDVAPVNLRPDHADQDGVLYVSDFEIACASSEYFELLEERGSSLLAALRVFSEFVVCVLFFVLIAK